MFNLQNDLISVYRWAKTNHMRWNNLKFQILRIGRNEAIKENTIVFSLDFGEVVDSKNIIKDLGIMVDKDFT